MDIQWYILSFETIPRYRKRLHGNGEILLPLPWDTKARGLLRWWRGWANNRCSPSTMA